MSKASVQVAVRVRPLNEREKSKHARPVLACPSPTECVAYVPHKPTVLHRQTSLGCLVDSPPGVLHPLVDSAGSTTDAAKPFTFDHVLWSIDDGSAPYASQEDTFECLGYGLLENAMEGFNSSLFAYGQTGSGKTFSMMGTPEDKGIIPRLCEALFDRIEAETTDTHKFKVEVSYLEIYNEKVRDLLCPATTGASQPGLQGKRSPSRRGSIFREKPSSIQKTYRIREHPVTGPYVENLSVHPVNNQHEILRLMENGTATRTTAATDMNNTSSRSHAVFTIILSQSKFEPDLNLTNELVSKISLVDLAGSERVKVSNTSGERLKEGANINKSLTTLGLVIKALVERSHSLHSSSPDHDVGSSPKSSHKGDVFVPYRDSILTWLLRDSLGGNSKTVILANVSPASVHLEETLSTLQFAQRARNIVNVVSVNENPSAKLIRDLKSEVIRLQSLLSTQQSETDEELGILQERLDLYERQMEEMWKKYEEEMQKKLASAAAIKIVRASDGAWDVGGEGEGKKGRELTLRKRASMDERKQLRHCVSLHDIKGSLAVRVEDQELPHFVNLSDDPELYSGIIIYFLREGTTRIGSEDADMSIDDPDLDPQVALIDCAPGDQEVWITPTGTTPTSLVTVNGLTIHTRTRLNHGDRVMFGMAHTFRMNHPREAREIKKRGVVRRVTSGFVRGAIQAPWAPNWTGGTTGRTVPYTVYPTPPRAASPFSAASDASESAPDVPAPTATTTASTTNYNPFTHDFTPGIHTPARRPRHPQRNQEKFGHCIRRHGINCCCVGSVGIVSG
ncbi:kinesin-like protein kif13a [Borealophlyctis nickersoniae]|nr:kinesin-like protein kif13a [Borealophlyctis nickersoniae]